MVLLIVLLFIGIAGGFEAGLIGFVPVLVAGIACMGSIAYFGKKGSEND